MHVRTPRARSGWLALALCSLCGVHLDAFAEPAAVDPSLVDRSLVDPSLISPSLTSPKGSEFEKREQTRALMQRLLRGVFGDARSVGYLGDMGSLPTALESLAARVGSPSYSTAHPGSVGMGFNGPYAASSGMRAGVYVDAWGTPISIETSGNTVRLVSAGPDRDPATLSDNVVVPLAPKTTHGNLEIEVICIDSDGGVVGSLSDTDVQVRVYSSSDGAETSSSATYSSASESFTAADLHLGRHYVTVSALNSEDYDVATDATVGWLRGRGGRVRLHLELKGEADDPKVTLCHKPASKNPKTLEVPASAVTAHLGHGDSEGACPAP